MSILTNLWKKFPLNLFTATGPNFNEYSIHNSEISFETSGFSAGLLTSSSQFIQAKIGLIKNIQTSKFDYKVDKKFDIEALERKLLFFGKCAVWKPGKTFLFDNFTVEKWGANSNPKIIKIHREKEDIKLIVGEDAIIFYSDCGFLFGKILLGPIVRLWSRLHLLERAHDEIMKNMMITNNKVAVPINASNDVVNALSQDLLSSSPVIKLSADGGLATSRDNKIDNLIVRMEDRTENLIKTFNFLWNQILEEIGIDSVIDKKERKINSEVNAENQIPKLINENQLNFRKKGLEEINRIFRKKYSVSLKKLEDEEVLEQNKEVKNESK